MITIVFRGISPIIQSPGWNQHQNVIFIAKVVTEKNEKDGHKSLDEIKKDLDVFTSLRKSDGISIAGGDPLTHPDILDIVAEIKKKRSQTNNQHKRISFNKRFVKEIKKKPEFLVLHFILIANKIVRAGKEKMKLS